MKKTAFTIFIILLMNTGLFSQIDFGSDLVSRYVWRGVDFGNTASIQPYMTYTIKGVEIGAWASYPLSNDAIGNNENDLYVSYAMGDAFVTITDYYFPEGMNFTDYSNFHIIELSGGYTFGAFSLLAAYNISGDDDNSFYTEVAYEILSSDDLSLNAAVGIGNGGYTTTTDPNLVNIALTASKGAYTASYIYNPDLDTNYLVFAYSVEF